MENILIIVIDALRADRVNNNNELTPVIDSLAENGERFTRCFACADKTTASIPTIQTGLYPTRHGILHLGPDVTERELRNYSSTTSLQESLSDTHTTIAAEMSYDLYTRGFDHVYPEDETPVHIDLAKRVLKCLPGETYERTSRLYHNLLSRSSPKNKNKNKLAGEVLKKNRANQKTDYFLDTIDDVIEPWFGFLHYYDTHWEYNAGQRHRDAVSHREYEDGHLTIQELQETHPDQPVLDRFGNYDDVDTVGDIKRRYDAAVKYVDNSIGRIVDYLQQQGEADNTAIIITSDHGESLTENGVLFSHRELFDQTWHTPLVINAPMFSGTEDRFVQHFDIVPTVLDMLESHINNDHFDGQSLVPKNGSRDIDRNAVFVEQIHNARQQAIRTNNYKYIRNLNENRSGKQSDKRRPAEQLYDIQTDPGESCNIVKQNPQKKSELLRRLEIWLESLPEPGESDSTLESARRDRQLMQQFEALGYKFDE
jgi:arylsulfatase A-like enzyme